MIKTMRNLPFINFDGSTFANGYKRPMTRLPQNDNEKRKWRIMKMIRWRPIDFSFSLFFCLVSYLYSWSFNLIFCVCVLVLYMYFFLLIFIPFFYIIFLFHLFHLVFIVISFGLLFLSLFYALYYFVFSLFCNHHALHFLIFRFHFYLFFVLFLSDTLSSSNFIILRLRKYRLFRYSFISHLFPVSSFFLHSSIRPVLSQNKAKGK